LQVAISWLNNIQAQKDDEITAIVRQYGDKVAKGSSAFGHQLLKCGQIRKQTDATPTPTQRPLMPNVNEPERPKTNQAPGAEAPAAPAPASAANTALPATQAAAPTPAMNQQQAENSAARYRNPKPISVTSRIRDLKKGHTRIRPHTVLKEAEKGPITDEPMAEVCFAIQPHFPLLSSCLSVIWRCRQ
jgi:hypothetical protein